jgi:hypothetical protein
MTSLIFVEGLQLGMLICGAVFMRYVRREMSAEIAPQLRRVQLQIDNLETAVNLALMTRYTELSADHRPAPPRPGSSGSADV